MLHELKLIQTKITSLTFKLESCQAKRYLLDIELTEIEQELSKVKLERSSYIIAEEKKREK